MEDTAPKPFVFVLMPFAEEFDDIYKVGIKPACKDAGAYCERVDEQIFHDNILERVYNQIAKADIIVADMTGRNANVFYETGYAHALGKQVILLTQNADDIPFDLKHYPHIVYEGKIAKLKEEVEKRVRFCVENPKKSLSRVGDNLEFFIDGIRLGDGAVITRSYLPIGNYRLLLQVAVHNLGNSVIKEDSINIGMILPAAFGGGIDTKSIELPENKILHLLEVGQILPDGWESTRLLAQFTDFTPVVDKETHCILKVFSELGTREITFNLIVRSKADEVNNTGSQSKSIIRLELADLENRKTLGENISIKTINHAPHNKRGLPEAVDENENFLFGSLTSSINSEYWRELADYTLIHHSFASVGFAATNVSDELAKRVRLEIEYPKDAGLKFKDEEKMPDYPAKSKTIFAPPIYRPAYKNTPSVSELPDRWIITVEFGDIQPKATNWSDTSLCISPDTSGIYTLTGHIYADNISHPQEIKFDLSFEVGVCPALTIDDLRQVDEKYTRELAEKYRDEE